MSLDEQVRAFVFGKVSEDDKKAWDKGQDLYDAGKHAEVIALLEPYAAQCPDRRVESGMRFILARAYEGLGELEKGLQQLDFTLDCFTDDPKNGLKSMVLLSRFLYLVTNRTLLKPETPDEILGTLDDGLQQYWAHNEDAAYETLGKVTTTAPEPARNARAIAHVHRSYIHSHTGQLSKEREELLKAMFCFDNQKHPTYQWVQQLYQDHLAKHPKLKE